jgi:signal transduction histidine kinase
MSAPVPHSEIEIVTEMPEHQMLLRPRAIMRRLGLIAAVLTMAGAAAAWALSRRLTRPLVQLTTAAEAISQGKYDGTVDVSRRDEIGRLAATFNRMTEQVRESHGALERHYDEARRIAEELERANTRLVSAVAEAQAANRAKSAFLATMSHEIRTPINAMLGYTELIGMGISGPITEEQRHQLERVRMSGQHLVGLVNEVLDFARIESSQLTVVSAIGKAEEAVDASLALVRPQADTKGIRLSSVEEGPAPYVGDPQRVRQILVNLLTNAVKFTPSGGRIRVEYGVEATPRAVAAGAESPAESRTFFRVRDTGIGIAPDELELIFEPFTQADSGYTRRQGGSGLGLSISRSLAHLMGGNVSVESEVGLGSCFTLVLPAAAATVASPAEGAATILR